MGPLQWDVMDQLLFGLLALASLVVTGSILELAERKQRERERGERRRNRTERRRPSEHD